MATVRMLILAVALLSAQSAFAKKHSPEAFNKLTAVDMAPGKAPRLVHGASGLSSGENRYLENLPMQLSSPIAKIKKAKYVPVAKSKKSSRKARPTATARDSSGSGF